MTRHSRLRTNLLSAAALVLAACGSDAEKLTADSGRDGPAADTAAVTLEAGPDLPGDAGTAGAEVGSDRASPDAAPDLAADLPAPAAEVGSDLVPPDVRPAGDLASDGSAAATEAGTDRAPTETDARETGEPDGDGVLRGYMVYAFELIAFEACGTTELISADLSGWEKGWDRVPDPRPFCVETDGGPAPCPGRIYVEMRGTISPPGQWGHLGKFERQVTIAEFYNGSRTEPAGCPFLPPVYPN